MKNTYLAVLWLAEKTVIGLCLAAMLTTWGILFLGSHAYRLGSQCRRTVDTVNTLYTAMSKTISARIPDDLYEQLQATAKALGVTVSQLISQAIAAHVNSVNMADPVETLILGQIGSHNRPESAVNSSELVARLEMVEARLTALEQRVAGIPSLNEQNPHLAGMTVKELRKLAGERGIPKYWLLSKADLIAALG